MKPSKRIKEICERKLAEHKQVCFEHGFMCHIGEDAFIDSAILEYLDEEYEEKCDGHCSHPHHIQIQSNIK